MYSFFTQPKGPFRAGFALFPFIFTTLFVFAQLPPNQPYIRVDQFGYLPDGEKVAVLANPQGGFNQADSYSPGSSFEVRRMADHSVAFSGNISSWNNGQTHDQSGDQVWWFDFSALTEEGEFYLVDVQNNVSSHPFQIAENVYQEVMKQAVRTFYYQRCGTPKTVPNVPGKWSDVACHVHSNQDLDCRLVSNPGNAALGKDLSGGWHDAGDYNKYVNFCHSVIHNLLFAFEHHPDIWPDDFEIPESGNGIPDLLDEVKWELDWLLKMQQADGSCLTKVSVTDFAADSPPSADQAPRRYGPATASSTRTIASIFAHAAIVYRLPGIASLNTYADTLEAHAIKAWNWISANPNPSSYDNNGFSSANPEQNAYTQDMTLLVAASYLFALTGDSQYRTYVDANYNSMQPLQWTFWYPYETAVQEAMLYYASLPNATGSVASAIQTNCSNSTGANNASMLPAYQNQTDAYRAYLFDQDYVWGSNEVKAHTASILLDMLRYNLDPANHDDYEKAAAGYVHYMHGVNALGMVMLSNMYDYGAEASVNEIYHSWFWDGTDFDNALTSLHGPAPGFLPGGPNIYYAPSSGYFSPPQDQPHQKSYLDWNTSWPENSWEISEVSIYVQAAYVRMLAHFTRLAEPSTNITPEEQSISFQIFPNPAKNQVIISLEGELLLDYQIQIFDLQGRICLTTERQTNRRMVLPLEQLSPGIYMVRLQNEGNQHSEILLIQ